MTILAIATVLLVLLACWLWLGLEEPEAQVTPRWLLDVLRREEMDQHPVERLDWQPYRRQRPERLRRPYSGIGR